MTGELQLVMQDLEHAKRRKKKSVLSKLAGSSNETSPRSVVDSLECVGDNSAERGLEGSRGHSELKQSVLESTRSHESRSHESRSHESRSHSRLDEEDTGLDELDSDVDDDVVARQNSPDVKKMALNDLNDDEYDNDDHNNDDDDDDDDDDTWRQKSSAWLQKHDVDDVSPRQHEQLLNGRLDVSDEEDEEDASELEEMEAIAAVGKRGHKSMASAAGPVLNSQHTPVMGPVLNSHHTPELVNSQHLPVMHRRHLPVETISEDGSLQVDSTSTLSSAMKKVYGLFTGTPAASESSAMGGSITKISTKDARNRFVFCLFLVNQWPHFV